MTDVRLIICDGFFQLLAHGRGEILGETQRRVVLDNRLLHPLNTQMGQVAESVLTGTAEEIAIPLSILAGCFGIDEPCRPSGVIATLAKERALKVMGEYPVALAALAAEIQDVLNAVEKIVGDDRLVTARIDRTFVDDESRVVRVAEHLVDLCV
ncbi:hypothetical protein [Mycobacterium pinniadriaticum]|uniref:hypothetical protein n=1 Tax=Mycobacterium pinniadriaticum TaxID=2994102 RepID=UPI002B054103|nr:hypothetical protein [Mycobacterium pinniadriaticum]